MIQGKGTDSRQGDWSQVVCFCTLSLVWILSSSLISQKSLGFLLPGGEAGRTKGCGNLVTSAVLEIVSGHLGSQRLVGERQSQVPP